VYRQGVKVWTLDEIFQTRSGRSTHSSRFRCQSFDWEEDTTQLNSNRFTTRWAHPLTCVWSCRVLGSGVVLQTFVQVVVSAFTQTHFWKKISRIKDTVVIKIDYRSSPDAARFERFSVRTQQPCLWHDFISAYDDLHKTLSHQWKEREAWWSWFDEDSAWSVGSTEKLPEFEAASGFKRRSIERSLRIARRSGAKYFFKHRWLLYHFSTWRH